MADNQFTDLGKLIDRINKLRAERGLPPRELRPGIDTSDSLRAELRQLEGRPINVTIEETLGGFLERDPLGLEEAIFGGLGRQPVPPLPERTQQILRTGQPFREEGAPPPGVDERQWYIDRINEIMARVGLPPRVIAPNDTPQTLAQEFNLLRTEEFNQALGQVGQRGVGDVSPDVAANLAFQRERLGFEQAAAEQNRINALRGQFGTQAAARGLGLIQRTEADIERAAQQRFASQFESFKSQILSGTAPRGFFSREALRGEVNPFVADPFTIQDRIGGIGSSLEAAETSLNTVLKRATAVEKRIANPDNTLTRSGVANPSTAEEFRARAVLDERTERESFVDRLEEQLGRAQDEFVSSGEAAAAQPVARPGGFTVGGPGGGTPPPKKQIPIPRALGEFFPQGIGGELVTPSAQAFGRLSFTEREQLLGGVQFRGGQPTELLEKIQAPLSPRKRGGRVAPIAFV